MVAAIQAEWALQPLPGDSHLGLREEVGAMERQDFVDSAAYAALLRRCALARDAEQGRRVHAHIVKSDQGNSMRFVGRTGHEKLRFLKNLAVEMYGKCGLVEEAKEVFDGIKRWNEYSWTMILSAYAHNGHFHAALGLFWRMLLEGIRVDSFTLSIAITVCSDLGDLSSGQSVRAVAVESGLHSDLVVATALVNLYGKCGAVRAAREIFDSIELEVRDSHCWNSMLGAYAQHGFTREAMRLHHEMDFQGMRSKEATLVTLLSSCSTVQQGERTYSRIRACGFDSGLIVQTAVLTMYGRFGKLEQAKEVFDAMPERTVVAWSALIAACAQNGCERNAFRIFRLMELEGVRPDHVTFVSMLAACGSLEEAKTIHERIAAAGYESFVMLGNSLVSLYGKCGSIQDARDAFDRITARNIVTWNSMIATYAQQGRGREVLELYERIMDEKLVKPNVITVVSILDACADMAALERGSEIHATHSSLSQEIESDIVVKTSLVNLYGKCGRVASARAVFDKIFARDVVAWNTMIAAYAQHGHDTQAMELYWDLTLEGVTPNDSSFVSILFSISHGGRRSRDAVSQLSSIREDYTNFTPKVEHYSCLVDTLARAGSLREAEELFFAMPCLPTEAVCFSLLNACKVHGDFDRAARVAERSFQLHGLVGNSQALVMLSSIFSSAGRDKLEDGFVGAVPSKELESFIEIDKVVHEFSAGDGSSHPRAEEIRRELARCVLDEQDSRRHHSEMLAVGLGLISTPHGRELQVVKKSRACWDCHAALKIISERTRRRIVLRDESKFHHFEISGGCSCKDCW
ncbi:pentatricopeptide repeat-containing protein At4g21065 [Selaginella moellendorffii]|uniref:pentatricopeptide repeat-containing protein At4g21065 n=1 Tax=Selaginella moellendorffii TaxID=88036 RepID=UPI000D1D099C|nr:pentatricopeptide repeat-containing protein At4g21065 [Selaginella moellendorffii]|eukprot:XP_024531411.1 pentatricopeptide repeat-containing protein At4g21065 [Selaginella moellendorffii]